jgi:hypothetical protein
MEQESEYNTLNLSGKAPQPSAKNWGDDVKIYSHLTPANESPYNVIDRERKERVVDGDYSYVQL